MIATFPIATTGTILEHADTQTYCGNCGRSLATVSDQFAYVSDWRIGDMLCIDCVRETVQVWSADWTMVFAGYYRHAGTFNGVCGYGEFDPASCGKAVFDIVSPINYADTREGYRSSGVCERCADRAARNGQSVYRQSDGIRVNPPTAADPPTMF